MNTLQKKPLLYEGNLQKKESQIILNLNNKKLCKSV